MSSGNFQLVQLASGVHSVRSTEYNETFHPVIGPVREARALYVEQLQLPERIAASTEEFVIWDIGLGAAANPLTLLNSLRGNAKRVRFVSFDKTTEPLAFALEHPNELPFVRGWEPLLNELLSKKRATARNVSWDLHVGDFPTFIGSPEANALPKPHAIFFDAYSPATNPEMWTVHLFRSLFSRIDASRPCAIPTYSRSTMLRVTLLVAGFFVGRGHATGEKEETTIAANAPELINDALDGTWLERVRRSTSAEPLDSPVYRQAPLSERTWAILQDHPQFIPSQSSPAKNLR